MKQLSPKQQELLSSLTKRLEVITGVRAVVLGGSYARGQARPDSDIDLGIFYSEAAPFSIEGIRELSESVNDTARPVVTDFYGWGPWVNGGAWLTIGGQRVDFIYRNLEQVERVIAEAEAGRYEVHYLQQDYLFMAEFTLTAFAPRFAARGDSYGTAACLTRAVNELVTALFALNRKYLINDKTALAEAAEFERAPREFGARVQKTLAHLGTGAAELNSAVQSIGQLVRETVELAKGLYVPHFTLPK